MEKELARTFDIWFYSEGDLNPIVPAPRADQPSLFSDAELNSVDTILERSLHVHQQKFPRNELSESVLTLLSVLDAFGALRIEIDPEVVWVHFKSYIATNFGRVFVLYCRHRFALVADWHHLRGLEGHFYGIDFLLFLEQKRIKYSIESGFKPEVFIYRNVAFAVIKARSQRRSCDVYLMQMNKDWQRYNFVGGKQEPIDRSDFQRTALREIEEELGIDTDLVHVTPLFTTVMRTYGLTGHNGVLCCYDGMVYQAFFSGTIPEASINRWFTEEELRKSLGSGGEQFMMNPYYRDYLLDRLPGGLAGLPYSLAAPVEVSSRLRRIGDGIVEHRLLIIAIITIVGALIALIKLLL